jgi:hypothetical protein
VSPVAPSVPLRGLVGNTFVATCALALAVASLHAQSPVRGAKTATESPTRTAWGHPDLQGRWTNATLTPLERPAEVGAKEFFTEAEAAEYQKIALDVYLRQIGLAADNVISREFADGVWMDDVTIVPTRRTSLIVGPTGRLPPMTLEAQERAKARAGPRKADGPEDRTLPERCLWYGAAGPPMIPFVYNSNHEIVQTPTHVAILSEQGNVLRTILLGGRPHLNDTLRQWQGDSRGRWEGDTSAARPTAFVWSSGSGGAIGTRCSTSSRPRIRRRGPRRGRRKCQCGGWTGCSTKTPATRGTTASATSSEGLVSWSPWPHPSSRSTGQGIIPSAR